MKRPLPVSSHPRALQEALKGPSQERRAGDQAPRVASVVMRRQWQGTEAEDKGPQTHGRPDLTPPLSDLPCEPSPAMSRGLGCGPEEAVLLWVCFALLALCVQCTVTTSCSAGVAIQLRKDCHPEPGATEATCVARNCCWSPSKAPSIPWCFQKEDSCALVSASERIDCYPEIGASEAACMTRGCLWCVSSNSSIPFCFFHNKEEAFCATRFPLHKRVNCHPHSGASQESCEAKGCFWCPSTITTVPWCFYPDDGPHGYTPIDQPQKTAMGWRLTLKKRDSISLFGNDISPIVLEADFTTMDMLHFKIYDPNNKRFEVPLDLHTSSNFTVDTMYDVEFSNESTLVFRIIRKKNGTVLWETSLGGLIFSNQFLQLMASVPCMSIYGFGEQEHSSFKHDTNFMRYGMYSRDQPPMPFSNLYGVHPFYMCIEKDFNAHGVLLLNADPQDVTLSPYPSLTFRTIGGIFDFYMFLGPTPENVVQQFTDVVGRPYLPPYWSLGFHLCRQGYSMDELKKTVDRMRLFDIPQVARPEAPTPERKGPVTWDVQYSDIDYMDRHMDFTYDRTNFLGLPEYVKELKTEGLHYVIDLDPFLTKDEPVGTYKPYDLGKDLGIWVNNSDGVTAAIGKAWPPGDCVFPDFTNPKTGEWWIQLCTEFKGTLDFDGIAIDMNEPANFRAGQQPGCQENLLNYPPFMPEGSLSRPSACQNATKKRAFVVSRSTFVGSGKYTGHWLGDNYSQWRDMHMSIIGMLEFNLFGIPYTGASVCGFNGNATYELCLRWMQLGAFYPYSRNHNAMGSKEQDPGVFGEEFAVISRSVLRNRYFLLPYLYTLFYRSHVSGDTVVRGLVNEFTSDPQAHEIDRAFLWGPALMIVPVLEEGEHMPSSWIGKFVEIPAPLDIIPLFIRGGHILPTQNPDRTTTMSRLNPLGLIIALDHQGEASGSLFWDDGDSIDSIEKEQFFYVDYKFSHHMLKTTVVNNGFQGVTNLAYGTIQILGLSARPQVVSVNGNTIADSRIQYDNSGLVPAEARDDGPPEAWKLSVLISAPLSQELTMNFELEGSLRNWAQSCLRPPRSPKAPVLWTCPGSGGLRNLLDRDTFSKSDPICVLYVQGVGNKEWREFGRTEVIDNTLNPDFVRKFILDYFFEERENLRFDLYDVDSKSPNLSKHDFLGQVFCTLGEIVGSQGSRLEKPILGIPGKKCGTIILTAEELNCCRDAVLMQFCANKLDKKDFFGKSDPFLVFYRSNEDGSFTICHRTEVVKNTLNPVWQAFKLSVRALCNGDHDRTIKVEVFDWDRDGSHDFIGEFTTSYRELSRGQSQFNVYEVVNPKKKGKKKKYTNSGTVTLLSFLVETEVSFLDYIKGGTQINFTVAIDFTASNGNPAQPTSLHYMNPYQLNAYGMALKAVGEIVQDYDSDKMFPALGFGARLPPDGRISHEFALNGNPQNPYCEGIDGVMEAYYRSLRAVQLYGPTNFAPVINHVARYAASVKDGSQYFVLLIVTDGVISDMAQTKESIVNASKLPMSIIIVGVGPAEFDAMVELDGDDVRVSSRGKFAERDIVQFVPFRDYMDRSGNHILSMARLAKDVLAEIPEQFLAYMRAHGVKPSPAPPPYTPPTHVLQTQI
nr:unnamed protein product [Sorex araneus]